MASSRNGRRDLRRATQAVAALAVVGTVGGSMLAFADTTKAAASTPTVTPSPGPGVDSGAGTPTAPTDSGSSSSGASSSSGDDFTAPPPLSPGSGSPVVTSGGS